MSLRAFAGWHVDWTNILVWATGLDVDGFLLDMGRVLELKNAVAAAKFGTEVHVRTFAADDVAVIAQIARRQLIVAINKVRTIIL